MPESGPRGGVSRRSLLRAAGIGVGAAGFSRLLRPAAAAQAPADPASSGPTPAGAATPGAAPTEPAPTAPATSGIDLTTGAPARPVLTVDEWRNAQTDEIYIAHRGSGDVYPEHSMVAYQAAADWGATCMEISVGITSDGVLICMHDATYDRTTNGTGPVLDQPSSVLDTIRIIQPQLGAAWLIDPPRVPLLEEVLTAFGGSIILCIEAKIPQAYAPMVALIEAHGLQQSVILKVHYSSSALDQALAAGYPVFAYLGSEREVTKPHITALAAQLRPGRDVLVIAAVQGPPNKPFLSDDLVAAAVDTGIPVWVFPLHRRSEAAHFFDLGVRGAICSSYGYIAGVVEPVTEESWADRRIASGEVTRIPEIVDNAPSFTTDGLLVLAAAGRQQFLMLGQFCPVRAAAASYTIDVDLSWLGEAERPDDNLTVAVRAR